MKKRLSKKVLAIFLAALMVATSIPLSVLHVFAADAWTDAAQDAEVIKIENKMSEFESKLYEKDVLIFLSKSDLINKSSRIIVEASLDTDFSYASELGYEIIKEKKYKTNKHVFLKLIGE